MNEQVAFWIAQSISVITALIAILSLQLKNMKAILACQISANTLAGLTYVLLGGLSGAGVSIIAVIQAIVMYVLKVKNVNPHFTVTLAFIAAFAAYSIWSYTSPLDLLPMGAAIFYSLSIAQKNPRRFRAFGTINPTFWLAYDIYTLALVNFLMHLGIFISGVVGVIRLDVIGRKKEAQSSDNAEEG